MLFGKVDYVELDGEKYPIAFNLKALHLGEKEAKVSFNEIIQGFQNMNLGVAFKAIPYFWHALDIGHRIVKKDNPISKDDFEMMDFQYFMPFIEKMTDAISKMDTSEKKQLKTVKKAKAEA